MALVPQPVTDVLIRPMNQQAPSTSAPVGRIKTLINKVATHFEGPAVPLGAAVGNGIALQIETRNGFQRLPKQINDVVTGALISAAAGIPTPTLLSSLGDRVVAVRGSNPYVLSENSASWSKYPYIYSPTISREQTVWAENVQVSNPCAASISGVVFRTWSQPATGQVFGMVIDEDGAVIRAPFLIVQGAASCRAKVVSDGVRFWVVYSLNTFLDALCFDDHGVPLASIALIGTLNGESASWDVVFTGGAICVASGSTQQTGGTDTVKLTVVSLSGSTITHNTTDLLFEALGNYAVAFADNQNSDTCAYLMTAKVNADSGGTDERAFRIASLTTTPVITGYFSVDQTSSSRGIIYDEDGEGTFNFGILNAMSGVVRGGELLAQLSFFDNTPPTPDDRRARTVFLTVTVGTDSIVSPTIRSVTLASSVFQIDGRDSVLVYYPADDTITYSPLPDPSLAITLAGEPSYFVIDTLTQQVTGRHFIGTAGMNWSRDGWGVHSPSPVRYGPFTFCLPRPFVSQDGKTTSVTCGFDCASFAFSQKTYSPNLVTSLMNAVGIADLQYGGVGQAVEFNGELLMPGAIATAFDGIRFSEQGISLQPQQMSLTQSNGGELSSLAFYTYIAVANSIDANGRRVQSATSFPVNIQLTGTNRTVTVVGIPIYMTTRNDITFALYRNVFTAGVPSTQRYRVDNPLNPIVNDPTTLTWTFVDSRNDLEILSGEVLYTDQLQVERDPMPSFSVGDVFDGRVDIVGPDNSISFSAQSVDGDATWFNLGQRIPRFMNRNILNLIQMDGRLVCISDNQVFVQDSGGFPDPTGANGNIQNAVKEPFTQGGNGFAKLIAQGVAYGTDGNGLWLISRGLVNSQMSSPVNDDISFGHITGIEVDSLQRLYVGLSATGFAMFDQISGVWSIFQGQTNPQLLHVINGNIAYSDDDTIKVYDPSSHTDIDNTGAQQFIATVTELQPFLFYGIKKFDRVWKFNIQGTTLDSHTVKMTATYDPLTVKNPIVETWEWDVDAGDVFSFEFQPKLEQQSAMSLKFEEFFANGASGQSNMLQCFGFLLGIEQGLARMPLSQRIKSNG